MGIFDKLKQKMTKETAKPEPAVHRGKTEKKKQAEKIKESAKQAKQPHEAKSAEAAKSLTTAHKILKHPVLSEKSFRLQAANKYCFYVDNHANKHQVKTAVRELYGIRPVSVNMVRVRPQKKYRWGRAAGMTKGYKKAVVTMPEGTVLNLTE